MYAIRMLQENEKCGIIFVRNVCVNKRCIYRVGLCRREVRFRKENVRILTARRYSDKGDGGRCTQPEKKNLRRNEAL